MSSYPSREVRSRELPHLWADEPAQLELAASQPARSRLWERGALPVRQTALVSALSSILHVRVPLGSCDGEGATLACQTKSPGFGTAPRKPLPRAPARAQSSSTPARAPADQPPPRQRPPQVRGLQGLGQVHYLVSGVSCGAEGARASICACTVFNTMTALGQSATRRFERLPASIAYNKV